MKISALHLTNFRCYENKKISFGENINLIYGPNAVGKTSVIEAIHVLGLTKSNRTANDNDMVRYNEEGFILKGDLIAGNKRETVMVLNSNKSKKVTLNNEPCKSFKGYIGFMPVVAFIPSDLGSFFNFPSSRRREFDIAFCQISKGYLYWSSNYTKSLKERNAVLKSLMQEENPKQKLLLEVITKQMIEAGKRVIAERSMLISQINNFLPKKHYDTSGTNEEFVIDYQTTTTIEKYEFDIEKAQKYDIKKGTTSVGPHRDDYIFLINKKNIAAFGSQGQKRNAVLSLKLTLADLLRQKRGECPIILLDDVFSELDKKRQNQLIHSLNTEAQTIITTSTLSDIDEELIKKAHLIELKEGSDVNEYK